MAVRVERSEENGKYIVRIWAENKPNPYYFYNAYQNDEDRETAITRAIRYEEFNNEKQGA